MLSIGTDFRRPGIGRMEIEDAVAVTDVGCEGLGDLGREENVIPV